MLQPKKQKHRKQQKGRSKSRLVETRGLRVAFGSYGLQALQAGRISSRQIEAARKVISHTMERVGKLWIRIFPDKPITKLPPEVTLGGGKGEVDHYVFQVRPGRILFELDGVPDAIAREALRKAGHKLPVTTKIVTRID
ncbi:MAG: 50S ribosomal protein L16 [bacterium]|nr:50S ribosomal protein L16 [bacterium]